MTARRRTTAVLVAALLGLASVGAACGDDDDDGGGETLSEAEFLEQGNAICAAGSEELDELGAMDADELFALMTSGEDPFAEINEQATNIGLTECADSEDGEEGEE